MYVAHMGSVDDAGQILLSLHPRNHCHASLSSVVGERLHIYLVVCEIVECYDIWSPPKAVVFSHFIQDGSG